MTDQSLLMVISMAAKGNKPSRIAEKTGIPAHRVQQIITTYGPDLGALANAADELRAGRTPIPTAEIPSYITATTDLLARISAATSYPGATQARRLSEEVSDLIAEWRRWEHGAAQRWALETRRAKLLAEIAAIDEQLTPTSDGRLSTQKSDRIRSWAVAHGYGAACPDGQPVHQSVIDAYEKAMAVAWW